MDTQEVFSKVRFSRILGGSLLVAGTSIGAGMLALPVVTAEGGFVPAFFIYFLCWFFMTSTGLLLLELCLKMPPDSNLVTLASFYLGKTGKFLAWGLYLFLFYCLELAYISGGGSILQGYLGGSILISQLLFVFGLGFCVYLGAKIVGRINSILMVGLIITYFSFVFIGFEFMQFDPLETFHWGAAFSALPVIFTSFSYQGIVSSLTTYLKRDLKAARIAIISGTTIAFCIYLIWNFIIASVVSVEGLKEAHQLGQTAIAPLERYMPANLVTQVGQAFAFFAIATSFLGVALGLLDFMADSMKVVKKGMRKVFLAFLTFVPPMIAALFKPDLFIVALTYAGGVGCALLLGFLPPMMAWVSRYRLQGHDGPVLLGGGKVVLFCLMLFVVIEIVFEIFPKFATF